MGESDLELFICALKVYEGTTMPIPEHLIDYIYVMGYMADLEYKNYYMDSTRMYRPKLTNNTTAFPLELTARCRREEVVDMKNIQVHDATIMEGLFL